MSSFLLTYAARLTPVFSMPKPPLTEGKKCCAGNRPRNEYSVSIDAGGLGLLQHIVSEKEGVLGEIQELLSPQKLNSLYNGLQYHRPLPIPFERADSLLL
ncbi:MAG: hypothetical protein GY774_01610 [Planctomycetes bacterium]|nr:hypothetical protein [Planctomycetota bacterium]